MSIMMLFDVVKMCVYSYDIKCHHSVTISIISYSKFNYFEKNIVENVFASAFCNERDVSSCM